MADGETDDLDAMLHDAVRETETEILTDAFRPEPAKEPDEPETPEETKEKPRDEQGKFKASEDEKPEQAEAKPEKSEDAMVPSSRLREVTDKSRKIEEENNSLRNLLTQVQTRLNALEQKPAPKEQQQENKLDPIVDPDGFVKSLNEQFEQKLRAERLNNNLAIAHVKHGETFEKAYEALLGERNSGNMPLVNQLTATANPGEAIVQWYRNQQTLKEVGNDPQAYRQKLRDELLKDPDFVKAAVEAARASAGQPNTGQRSVVQMPPSLSRVAGSSKNADPIDTDDSDKAVFDYAFSR